MTMESNTLSNINAETAVLGCTIMDTKCAALVLTRLSEDDFTNADTAAAFRELCSAWNQYRRVDAVIVQRLPHADFLVRCAGLTPSISSCEIYIQQVQEHAVQMRAAALGLEIATGNLTVDEIAARAASIARLTAGREQEKSHAMPELMVDFLKAHQQGAKPQYILAGLGLDGIVRLRPGNYLVIGARPSVGKTAYSIQMALNFARQGKRVLYFSLETSRHGIAERVVACGGKYRFEAIQDNEIDWNDVHHTQTLEYLAHLPLFVNDSISNPAVMEALACAGKFDAIVVDYLGLMNLGRRTNSLYERVTELSMALHNIAQKNGLLVVALCQLNRGGTGVPRLEHLRESGQIEQDADAVILLHNDEQAQQYAAIVAKNKTGKCGAIPLRYDKETQHFTVIETRREEI